MNRNIYQEFELFEGVYVPVCHYEKYGSCEFSSICNLTAECVRQADYDNETINELKLKTA